MDFQHGLDLLGEQSQPQLTALQLGGKGETRYSTARSLTIEVNDLVGRNPVFCGSAVRNFSAIISLTTSAVGLFGDVVYATTVVAWS